MLTALIVLFVAKSIVIDLLVLWMLKDYYERINFTHELLGYIHTRLETVESDSRNMSTALMSMQVDLGIENLDDVG